jgi:hypothetical protein
MAHQVVEGFQYLAQVEVVLVVIFQVDFLAAAEEAQAGVAVIPEAVMEALMDQILAQIIRSGYRKSRNSTGNSNTM